MMTMGNDESVFMATPAAGERMAVTLNEPELRAHFTRCRAEGRAAVWRRAVKNAGAGTVHVSVSAPMVSFEEDLTCGDVTDVAIMELTPGGKLMRI